MRVLPRSFRAAATAHPAWLLAALALWLLATLGLRPLMLPDEGRYVGVAWAMVHGDRLTPLLHGLPYFHKPPLLYWIDATAMRWLGAHEAVARLAPALGAWLMGAAIFLDLRRRRGAREAAIALAVLATCPFFFVGGQFANLDMLVAGWISVVIVCGARAAEAEAAREALRWAVAAWLAAALAVLAKGLIGVVLPALVLAPWLLLQRRWRGLLRLLHPLALLGFVLVAAPWFVAMQQRFPAFLDYFFVEQHFRRYAQTGFNNVQPFWFFVPVLLLLTLPWSLWLPAWLRRRSAPGGAPAALYAWWALAVLLFFSMPASKLVGYALPALGPLAALAAMVVARGRAWRWLLPLTAAGCVALVVVLARHDGGSHREIAQRLRGLMQPGERVVLVGQPFFDVPFYARLAQPPLVLENWDDPGIPRRDDWRKELLDAARFAPDGGRSVLVRPAQWATLRCTQHAAWVLAAPDWRPPDDPPLGAPVLADRHAALWRLPPAPCP